MIDPMHNLLLGSAKTFTNIWKLEAGHDHSHIFATLQKAIDDFVVPAAVGRLPRKVESGFANFKAEEWKNWILIYSLVCFKSVLSVAKHSM